MILSNTYKYSELSENILNEFIKGKYLKYNISEIFTTCDKRKIVYTSIIRDTDIGLVIIPGMTIPRESYLSIPSPLVNASSLIFDISGQSESDGQLDFFKIAQDINDIGLFFKKKYKLRVLIGIGHSFGGMCLLYSSTLSNHPFHHRIALAPPADLYRVTTKIPEIMPLLSMYLYNLLRTIKKKSFRDSIALKYFSISPFAFINNPSILALNVYNYKFFNYLIEHTPKLYSFLSHVKQPASIIYTKNDNRLKNTTDDKSLYNEIYKTAKNLGFAVHLLDNLNHRFNIEPEKRLLLTYNNNILINLLTDLIRNY